MFFRRGSTVTRDVSAFFTAATPIEANRKHDRIKYVTDPPVAVPLTMPAPVSVDAWRASSSTLSNRSWLARSSLSASSKTTGKASDPSCPRMPASDVLPCTWTAVRPTSGWMMFATDQLLPEPDGPVSHR